MTHVLSAVGVRLTFGTSISLRQLVWTDVLLNLIQLASYKYIFIHVVTLCEFLKWPPHTLCMCYCVCASCHSNTLCMCYCVCASCHSNTLCMCYCVCVRLVTVTHYACVTVCVCVLSQ